MTTLTLAASVLLAAAAAPVATRDPPIRVKLSEDSYAPGERARVRIKTEHDGNLVVLRMDADGHIRVLFPLSPDDDAQVRGGKEVEVRSRGDREAFAVNERSGSGLVLAAVSAQPFNFEEFTRGGRWDAGKLALADTTGGDSEATLLDLVDRMTSGHYDYDAVTYVVGDRPTYRMHPAWAYGGWYPGGYYSPWPYNGFGFGLSFGRGRRHHW